MKKNTTNDTILAVLGAKVDDVKIEVSEIKRQLDSKFVTQDQFIPVRNVVYGLVTLILTGVVGALIALVVNK